MHVVTFSSLITSMGSAARDDARSWPRPEGLSGQEEAVSKTFSGSLCCSKPDFKRLGGRETVLA